MKNNKRKLDFNDHKGGQFYSFFLKPLLLYLETPEVEDVQVREEGVVTLIKSKGRIEHIQDPNLTIKKLKIITIIIGNMNKVKIDIDNPSISVILPLNNIRFTAEISKSIKSGILLSIRIPSFLIYKPQDFNISQSEFDFFKKHIAERGHNAFIIGGTGTGKTSFANMLVNYIPKNEPINIIGDLHDYFFDHEYKLAELYAKTKEEYQQKIDLLMRTNPVRILVSELTTYNVTAILRLINTGHKGFLLTLHANDDINSVSKAFSKNLSLSGEHINHKEIAQEIDESIDFLIYMKKLDNGERAITKVTINNKTLLNEAKKQKLFSYLDKTTDISKISVSKSRNKKVDVLKILTLRKKGKTIREIVNITKHAKNTVSKVLKNVTLS